MSQDIAIKVDNVSKTFKLPHEKQSSIKGLFVNLFKAKRTYEKQKVLSDISFEVKKGEFFGIVGRNGSGKSTLLKLLAGIYSPDQGAIHINGKLTPFIELGVGFNPELTGRENVFLNGALLGFNRKEMTAMYDEIVEFAELEKFMDQKLKNYSSGMQVRLAFSIAIRARSEILVLDEVLAVGDAAFQRKCYDYFLELKKNKKTVVLVTHDMSAVRQYCDRALMIENSKIVKEGSPEAIAQEYQKLFLSQSESMHSADSKRWGTGKLKVKESNIKVTADQIILECSFMAATDLPPPVFGFSIFGPSGALIMESNTLRLGYKTRSVTKGHSVEVRWELPNIFANGNYQVSVATCNQGTTEFYDWVNSAVTFNISKLENTAGLVDPVVSIIELDK